MFDGYAGRKDVGREKESTGWDEEELTTIKANDKESYLNF